jgi:hypothetical protein
MIWFAKGVAQLYEDKHRFEIIIRKADDLLMWAGKYR